MEVDPTATSSLSNETKNDPQRHRLIRAQLSFLQKADGSCNLEQGKTVIWCGVNGPGDCPSSKRCDNKLYIEVVYRCGPSHHNMIKVFHSLF